MQRPGLGGLLFLAALVPLAAFWWLVQGGPGSAPAAAPAVLQGQAEPEPEPAQLVEVAPERQVPAGGRTIVKRGGPEAALGAPTPARPDVALHVGRAQAPDGRALAGVGVGLESTGVELARTGEEGRFELTGVVAVGERLKLVDPGYTTLAAPTIRADPGRAGAGELVIVGAALGAVVVQVADKDGKPVESVRIALTMSERLHVDLAPSADALGFWSAAVTTGADGEARFEALPKMPDVQLTARRQGFAFRRTKFDGRDTERIRLTLGRSEPRPDQLMLQGRAVLHVGGGAPWALVRHGRLETQADAQGHFSLALRPLKRDREGEPVARRDPLIVAAPGCAPAVVAIPSDPLEFLTVLLFPAEEIDGRLVLASGEACPGWRIKLLDGEIFDRDSRQPFQAEDLAGGFLGPRATDVRGGFRFGGLIPGQRYRLQAWNLETLEVAVSAPIAAGARDFLFVVPHGAPRPRVEGLVTDPEGNPVAGCRVRLTMVEHETENSRWMHSRPGVLTDRSGRFEILDVPRSALFLRFNTARFPSERYDLAPDDPGVGLHVVLGAPRPVTEPVTVTGQSLGYF